MQMFLDSIRCSLVRRGLLWAALVLGLSSPQTVFANYVGCAAGGGGILTGIAAIGGISFPPTLIGTGGIIVGEVAAIGADGVKLAKDMDPVCPASLGSTAPPSSSLLSVLASHTYPLLATPPGASSDQIAFLNATNQLITEREGHPVFRARCAK